MTEHRCPGCNEVLPSPRHFHTRQCCEEVNWENLILVVEAAKVLGAAVVNKYHYKGYMTAPYIGDAVGPLDEAIKKVEHLL